MGRLQRGVVILAFKLQIDAIGGGSGAREFGRGNQACVGLSDHFVDITVFGIIHSEVIGGILEMALGIEIDAFGFLRLDQLDRAVFERDDGIAALHDGGVSRQPRPGEQQNLRAQLLINKLAGFDLHGLTLGSAGIEVQLDIGVHLQFFAVGIVGGAEAPASSVLEDEIGGAIGGSFAGFSVDGHSRAVNRHQTMRRQAFSGNGQRDQNFAFGIELVLPGLENGEGAFYSIEQISLFMEEVQADAFQLHARAVFLLFEISGPHLDDLAALFVGLDVVPVFGLTVDPHGQHSGLGRCVGFHGAPLIQGGETNPAEDRTNSQ